MDTVMTTEVIELFRPAGADDIAALERCGWKGFTVAGPAQNFFFPLLSRELAERIARCGYGQDGGYLLGARVQAQYLARFERYRLGAADELECRVPVEHLPEFNRHIVGRIQLLAQYSTARQTGSHQAA